jgi:hypothetical protein
VTLNIDDLSLGFKRTTYKIPASTTPLGLAKILGREQFVKLIIEKA